MGTEPRATDAAATRLLVNVAGLVAREIEAIVGPDYDFPLAPKVSARSVACSFPSMQFFCRESVVCMIWMTNHHSCLLHC